MVAGEAKINQCPVEEKCS
ncbi:MAG: hypothetical protein ACLRQF_06240 [Thomasclavelia ramosa]